MVGYYEKIYDICAMWIIVYIDYYDFFINVGIMIMDAYAINYGIDYWYTSYDHYRVVCATMHYYALLCTTMNYYNSLSFY